LLSIYRDQERGAKRKLLQGLGIPSGLPEHGSLGAVQGDHERLVGTVAAKHQGAVGEDRRAAVAVNRLVMDIAVRPDQCAFPLQACGALVSEVDIEPLTVRQGSRAGVAVLAVDARRLRPVLSKDLSVPDGLSCLGIEAKSTQGLIALVALLHRDGRSQVNEPAADNGRGPAFSRNWFSPGDVLGRAPVDWIMPLGSDPLAGRSAKLRPVVGADP